VVLGVEVPGVTPAVEKDAVGETDDEFERHGNEAAFEMRAGVAVDGRARSEVKGCGVAEVEGGRARSSVKECDVAATEANGAALGVVDCETLDSVWEREGVTTGGSTDKIETDEWEPRLCEGVGVAAVRDELLMLHPAAASNALQAPKVTSARTAVGITNRFEANTLVRCTLNVHSDTSGATAMAWESFAHAANDAANILTTRVGSNSPGAAAGTCVATHHPYAGQVRQDRASSTVTEDVFRLSEVLTAIAAVRVDAWMSTSVAIRWTPPTIAEASVAKPTPPRAT
jgi:hypothetical protein